MLAKKSAGLEDVANYRPISLTSCVGKVVERVLNNRLSAYLEANNLLLKQQSGFRANRSTTDNLLFLVQKAIDAKNRGKKCAVIFSDISKAFDKVWHDGLLFKMMAMKIPPELVDGSCASAPSVSILETRSPGNTALRLLSHKEQP